MIAIFLLAANSARAEEVRLDTVYFKNVFADLVKKAAPWPTEDLAVENFSARPEELFVPEGSISYNLQNPLHPNYLGRKVANVEILVDGRPAGEVKMAGDLQLYGEVVCLKQNLSRHSVLTEADVELVRRDISALGVDLITSLDGAVGQRLRSSLRAGSVLSSNFLEPPPLVGRGDLVTITVRSDNFSITVPGEARGEGARGEMVKVKNLMSRKEIFARVVNRETVEVDL